MYLSCVLVSKHFPERLKRRHQLSSQIVLERDMFPCSYLSCLPLPQMGSKLLNLSVTDVGICQGFPCFPRTVSDICEETAPYPYLFKARSKFLPLYCSKQLPVAGIKQVWAHISSLCKTSTISSMYHYYRIEAISGCALPANCNTGISSMTRAAN